MNIKEERLKREEMRLRSGNLYGNMTGNVVRNNIVKPVNNALLKQMKKRETSVKKLQEALSLTIGDNDVNDLRYNPLQCAQLIEEELTKTCGSVTSSKYTQKIRTLIFNISDIKNFYLRYRILKGDLVPSQIINMTSADLANEDLKNKRKEIEKKALNNVLLNDFNVQIIKKTHKGEIHVVENSLSNYGSLMDPVDLESNQEKDDHLETDIQPSDLVMIDENNIQSSPVVAVKKSLPPRNNNLIFHEHELETLKKIEEKKVNG